MSYPEYKISILILVFNIIMLKLLLIIYTIVCIIDSFIVRNLKKKVLYINALKYASIHSKKLVVLGSPHLDLQTGGVISYVTEKTFGPSYGCGDVCVDIEGCRNCEVTYTGDILDFLKNQDDDECVLFSTGVLEFTDNYDEISKEIKRTCVRNFTDYYSPWNITWYTYGCSSSGCGLFKGIPRRLFLTNPFKLSGEHL